MTPILETRGLSKHFHVDGGLFSRKKLVRAVDRVSLRVEREETVALVGESGCGKSTLGRLALRLVEPTEGTVLLDGTDITRLGDGELRPLRKKMQIIFQDPFSSLDPRMTVRDIVAEGIRVHRIADGKDLDDRVRSLLARVGLRDDQLDRYPHEFSGGQRQRIGIARALAVEPEVIVCDEPTSALDVSIQAQILNLLAELQESLSLSYLLISHDLKVVEHASKRVAVMYLGRIVEEADTTTLFRERAHPYTRALFASVPVPDPDRKRVRVKVLGDPPSPLAPPPGCAFHPRCPRAEKGTCDVEAPVLRELAPGHEVACFFPGEA